MRVQVEIAGKRHLETLGNCGGFYSCPKDPDGRRLGSLVGYAGKYEAPDGSQKQWVGDIYANFAKAEMRSNVLEFFAKRLAYKMESNLILDARLSVDDVNVFCGAPIGGYALATALGINTGIDVIKAEKKVIALATSTSREKSELVFSRHSVEVALRYVIVEDVCNNFSTTEQLIQLICSGGGHVAAILCFLNRSLAVDSFYYSTTMSRRVPVVSLVRLPINEWKQDDPAVADDIAKGNVVWKPKDEWNRLMEAMKAHA